MKFAHLHLHTNFSILNGVCKLNELAKELQKIEQTSAAITDHGNMFGVVSFYEILKKNNIKPIIGCELYLDVSLQEKGFKNVNLDENSIYHLVVLCENKQGYSNLVKIVSLSYLDNFLKIPRVSFSLLKKYKEGLIFLSGCRKGEVAQHILNNDLKKARDVVLKYKSEFGKHNFFLELQFFGENKDRFLKDELLKIAKETEVFAVATNNVHYIKKQDKFVKEVVDCIKNFKTIDLSKTNSKVFGERYLKSFDEMKKNFGDCEEALKNTIKIADRCEFDFEFFRVNIPKYKSGTCKDNEQFLKEKAKEGLLLKYGKNPGKEIIKRFIYEFRVIVKMGFVDYFLIVYDYVNYGKKRGIFVGPGRGSGAGSLISYCLNITEVDPIKFDLSFDRFLNIYRTKMPDFDVDFCNERRHEVIEYVIKKYGSDRVARIITFGTLAAKAALRDVGRVLNMPYDFVDIVVKKMPKRAGVGLDDALKESQKLKNMYVKFKNVKLLFKVAKKVEGLLKNTSIHAAAVVITRESLLNYIPLYRTDEIITTQYDMADVERLNFLKMDFLGLRNLTLLYNTEKLINIKNKNFRVANIREDDEKTFRMLSKGDSVGVFQLESKGMQVALKKVCPTCLKDVMDVMSLNRPGPSQFIDLYANNKNNPEKIKYLNDSMKKILFSTYGVIIYQEQVMRIFKEIAGYSLKNIDLIRKAISKKDLQTMKKEAKYFVYGRKSSVSYLNCEGAIKRGVDEKTAKTIFCYLIKFAQYSFNKSHAAAYSIISYKTAYLKCNFLLEYMVCLLNSVIENKDKLKIYLEECKKNKIEVLPVDVNESETFFKIEGENSIRFSFLALKNVSRNFSDVVIKERNKKKYVSLKDFIFRIFYSEEGGEFNKNFVLALIESGAFSEIEKHEGIFRKFEDLLDEVKNKKREIKGQISLLENNSLVDYSDESKEIKLKGVVCGVFLKKLNSGKKIYVLKLYFSNRINNILIVYEKFIRFKKYLKKGCEVNLTVETIMKNDRNFLIFKSL